MSFAADVITLFPDLFPGPLGASVIGRGAGAGLWTLRLTQLRDFANDKHHSVDDTPAPWPNVPRELSSAVRQLAANSGAK